jgi:rubrerythrin
MSIDLLKDRGTPLDQQRFTWKELASRPYSKLDDDAFTRIRVILMNGIESDQIRFGHVCSRMNRDLQLPLARLRRAEQHQETLINWLNPPDQNPLETTIGYEQVAIEVTAALALKEPDPYLAQQYRFGLLEDFDHMYRYAALMDRVEGKDPNNLLQSYTDILPGRPVALHQRHPDDDMRAHYDRKTADLRTKLHAYTLVASEFQTHDYYMNIGPLYPDPVGRQLYAEIASVEEQHVTEYEAIIDAGESWLEKLLLMQATEVYNYYSCVESEKNPRIKAIWERFLDYELGHVRYVADLFERFERRDAAEILSAKIPEAIDFVPHREFIRQTLRAEVNLTCVAGRFMPFDQEPTDSASNQYRAQLHAEGLAANQISAGYVWQPGTELANKSPRTELETMPTVHAE